MTRNSKNIAVALKTCKHRCHLLEGYVGLKRIRFAAEMGYKKCTVCDCHFLFSSERTNNEEGKKPPLYCGCCNTKMRVKNARRNMKAKISAEKFKMEIIQEARIVR
jgi:hypothetical protein